MVFMGIDSDLHARIGNDTAIDAIVQGDRPCNLNLGHPALYCRNADSHCKVSEMRQQFSYA
jgi:hypothetical protein